MFQSPRNPTSFHRYFSTDGVEHGHGPPLVTGELGGGSHVLSVSPINDSAALPSSPAALFLSAFSPGPAAPALEPDGEGQVVGGFTLGPIIAHGGFSTIRRATSATNGSIVAVKCVPKQRERGAARRIAHEETIWTSLSHEHILPLFACIHTPTTDFFVTQLCPAGSLFDIMRGGVPGREDAGRMFRQIVRGLRYLHTEKRLVHRDIKLENVLVDEAGVCRIADFGMASGMDETGEWSEPGKELLPEPAGIPIHSGHGNIQRAVSLAVPRSDAHPLAARRGRPNTTTTTEEFQPGSLPYAAPELLGPPPLTSSTSMTGKTKAAALAGKSNSAFVTNPKASAPATTISHNKHPAPAQDIWALGVLLYALLMGRLPFMDSFEPRLVLKILGGTYVPPTNVNARTLAVLHGCLAARVQDRWGVERVDEAAWCVGGEDMPNDSADSDECPDAAEHPHPRHPHGHAHAAKHPPPAPLPLDLDRGRPGAAARRASDRAERSSSRAPYSASLSSASRTHSHSHSVRSGSRSARSGSRSARSRARDGAEEGSSSESHSQSQSRSRSRTGSRSRSRSPGPRTPVDSLPPLLGFAAIGLGFPTGKGPGRGFAAPGSSVEGRRGAGVSEEGEGVGEVLGESLLLSPEGAAEDLDGAARRAGSTPPGAWRGGGPGAGRSRSLSGT